MALGSRKLTKVAVQPIKMKYKKYLLSTYQ